MEQKCRHRTFSSEGSCKAVRLFDPEATRLARNEQSTNNKNEALKNYRHVCKWSLCKYLYNAC